MGVYEGRGQIGKATKELHQRWLDTKAQWDDVNAHAMEEKFLVPLEKDVRSAVGAMDDIGKLLQQIRNACE